MNNINEYTNLHTYDLLSNIIYESRLLHVLFADAVTQAAFPRTTAMLIR